MFAAAVYPPLFHALASGRSVATRRWAVAAGCVVAFLVGVSRFILWTHSSSEIVAGWLEGGLVSMAVLARPISLPARLNVAMLAAAALWLMFIPAAAPTLDTHSVITRLALKVSGHERPYTRSALLRSRVKARALSTPRFGHISAVATDSAGLTGFKVWPNRSSGRAALRW
jgi:hypothetical protein